MFLLYLGEKRIEEHIVTKAEVGRGCFSLNEKAEYGSVLGLADIEYLTISEYGTQKREDATNENGTDYVSYDTMVTGDKIQLQYVKLLEKEESIGRNAGFDFKTYSRDNKYFSARMIINFNQMSLLNERFVEMLKTNKKIEVIIAESLEKKTKYFIFGFGKSYDGPDFLNPEEPFDEVYGSADLVVGVTWGK